MMKSMTLAAATALAGALLVVSPAHAVTTWNFSTPAGDQGLTQVYTGDDGTSKITASAFGPALLGAPAHLFGKTLSGDEAGLGLTNDPLNENEISVGSFIQLSLANLGLLSLNISFSADSTTNNEGWQVFGTNTPGTLGNGTIPAGATSLGTCVAPSGSGSGNACEGGFNFATGGMFTFLDVTAINGPGNTGANVLLHTVDALVPGPVVGAGLPGLVAACGALLALVRRRRQQIV
jgi:hypothetical protein